jgi:hypothetical protein
MLLGGCIRCHQNLLFSFGGELLYDRGGIGDRKRFKETEELFFQAGRYAAENQRHWNRGFLDITDLFYALTPATGAFDGTA